MSDRKKYIVYTGNKAAADAAFQSSDIKECWHNVVDGEVVYKGFQHFKQVVVDNKSVTIMKLKDKYYNDLLKPMIQAGLVECLGKVEGDACDYDDPRVGITDDEWIKIREIYPKAGVLENIEVFGQTIQVDYGFIDVK